MKRLDRRDVIRRAGAGLGVFLAPIVAHAAPKPAATPAAKPAPKPIEPSRPVLPASVWSLQFSPDGKILAAGGYREVRLFDVAAKTLTQTLPGHSGPVRCLAWSADGAQLAAGGGLPGELGEVKLWRAPFEGTSKPVAEMKEHRDVVEGVAFSSTGDAVLSASNDEKALVVKLDTRKVAAAMQDHNNRIVAVAVAPSGKYVATGSLDKTVKIWNGADYKPLANIDNTGGAVYALTFLPGNSDTLAVAGEDGNVRLFRLNASKTGNLTSVSANVQRTYNGNRTPILTLAVSAKGEWLVSAGDDALINVYETRSGNRKHQIKDLPAGVYSLALSPDGTLLAAGCRDGKIRLWTTADGKPAGEI